MLCCAVLPRPSGSPRLASPYLSQSTLPVHSPSPALLSVSVLVPISSLIPTFLISLTHPPLPRPLPVSSRYPFRPFSFSLRFLPLLPAFPLKQRELSLSLSFSLDKAPPISRPFPSRPSSRQAHRRRAYERIDSPRSLPLFPVRFPSLSLRISSFLSLANLSLRSLTLTLAHQLHRPLGSTNRLRRVVYAESRKLRLQVNGYRDYIEPDGLKDVPAPIVAPQVEMPYLKAVTTAEVGA